MSRELLLVALTAAGLGCQPDALVAPTDRPVQPNLAIVSNPDYRMTWSVTVSEVGTWQETNLPFWKKEVTRRDALLWEGTADITGGLVTSLSTSGSFSTVTTDLTTFTCGAETKVLQNITDFSQELERSSTVESRLAINASTDQSGSVVVLDPFVARNGFSGSAFPAVNTVAITTSGSDCSQSFNTFTTQTDPGFFTGIVFSPGDIPADNASGTSFSKDASITYFPDPAGAVPFTVQWHVSILKEPLAPPVAHAGGPYTSPADEVVTFDGSRSVDGNGSSTGLHYTWDFGDGLTGSGVAPTHIYAGPGIFTVILTVVDQEGLFDTDQATATISPKLTPTQQIGRLNDGVAGLLLNKDQANALITKLDQALKKLAAGKVGVAINQLTSFVDQLSALIRDGVLTPSQGQPLIDRAGRVISALTT